MRHPLKLSLPALATALLLAACGSGGYSTGSSGGKASGSGGGGKPAAQTSGGSGMVVKTASSAALGVILTDSQGLTLYHLSGEGNGKFICTTSACLGAWHPLTVSEGSTPKGEVSSLGTVKRPDGTTQVTYKGSPLYTFAQDSKPGETNGEGFKDVGTWTAVTASSSSASSSGGGGTTENGGSSGGGGTTENGGSSGGGGTTENGGSAAYSYGEEGGYKY